MDGTRASDEVIDEIAYIAMLRYEAERQGGGGASSSEALRKLHELRDREQKAMHESENAAVHQANLDAVAAEIRKVQQMNGSGGRNAEHRNARPRPQQQQQPRKDGGGGHGAGRNKGRRSMGRQGRP